MTNVALSLMVLTALALVAGAIWFRHRGGSTKQMVLMLVLAAVIAANVAIWILPDASGDAPLNQLPG